MLAPLRLTYGCCKNSCLLQRGFIVCVQVVTLPEMMGTYEVAHWRVVYTRCTAADRRAHVSCNFAAMKMLMCAQI